MTYDQSFINNRLDVRGREYSVRDYFVTRKNLSERHTAFIIYVAAYYLHKVAVVSFTRRDSSWQEVTRIASRIVALLSVETRFIMNN